MSSAPTPFFSAFSRALRTDAVFLRVLARVADGLDVNVHAEGGGRAEFERGDGEDAGAAADVNDGRRETEDGEV